MCHKPVRFSKSRGAPPPGLDVRLVYVALFGLGSVLGMASLSGAIVFSVINLTSRRMERLRSLFNATVALVSVGLGLRLLLAL